MLLLPWRMSGFAGEVLSGVEFAQMAGDLDLDALLVEDGNEGSRKHVVEIGPVKSQIGVMFLPDECQLHDLAIKRIALSHRLDRACHRLRPLDLHDP